MKTLLTSSRTAWIVVGVMAAILVVAVTTLQARSATASAGTAAVNHISTNTIPMAELPSIRGEEMAVLTAPPHVPRRSRETTRPR